MNYPVTSEKNRKSQQRSIEKETETTKQKNKIIVI